MREGKMKGCIRFFLIVTLIALFGIGTVFADVTVTEDQSLADKFVRYTVTGITTPLPQLPDVTGFIGASYLTVADVDNDTIKEIIATSGVGPDSNPGTSNGEVALFTWDGTNKSAWTKTILSNTFAFPNETVVKDIDNDTELDIVVCDHFIGNPTAAGGVYYLKNGGGNITNPANWTKRTIHEDTTPNTNSYHRAYFLDLDGDLDDDAITTNFAPWTGWLENTGIEPYTPHTIGTGGGSLFAVFDMDEDGDLDIIAPQFAITTGLFSCIVLGGPSGTDPLGDSLVWFENPGPTALAANPNLAWNRYTMDNWYTSSNPLGKGMEIVVADIDNDTISELIVSNHNHQNKDGSGARLWPSGIYYFEIPGLAGNPGDPKLTADWVPLPIETGNPLFVYSNGAPARSDPYNDSAVLADVYAVDRRGSYYDQGSPGMVRAEDINGDGRVDLVVPGDGKGRLYYYEAGAPAGGNLTFKRSSLYADLQCMPGDAKIVDLDEDGRLDIIAAIFDTSVTKPYPYTSSSIFMFNQDPDRDADGTCTAGMTGPGCSGTDKCPYIPNGPAAGTCISENSGMFGKPCTTPGPNPAECGFGGICSMAQEDADSNGIGDACEKYCFADCTNDPKVNLTDLGKLKGEFGRTNCNPEDPVACCKADTNGDKKVNLTDLGKLKGEFGRTNCPLRINRCPF
jgi:hypothetical protein